MSLDKSWHKSGDPYYGTDHYEPNCPYCDAPHVALTAGFKLRRNQTIECRHCRKAAKFVGYGERLEPLAADVRKALRDVGVILSKADGEYRVNFRGGAEGTAYYTNDVADALATGRHMARGRV